MDHREETYDKAYLMHVGMNIADKSALMEELYRVLKPGGSLGVFDIMSTSDETLDFPVPWASEASGSSVSTLAEYKLAAEAAGFRITGERNRHQFAVTFFDQLQARTLSSGGPPPLGLHIVMGDNAGEKIANMVQNVKRIPKNIQKNCTPHTQTLKVGEDLPL